MATQGNLAPIIIKRKKIIAGGHHGGAWKVAYADFVTAMMAFFMMMWLLNATTEQQRSGLADYFSPTVAISRVSGGGDGSFGGDSIFSEEVLPKSGTGATAIHMTESEQSRGQSGMEADGGDMDQAEAALQAAEEALLGRGGESEVMDNLLQHIMTRITDEGLVIELFALEERPLFDEVNDTPTQLMRDLVALVANVSTTVTNSVAIEGHVRARAIVLSLNPIWDVTTRRAGVTRELMEAGGVSADRMRRVTGHGDREAVVNNTMALRNDRVEIVLLR